MPGDRRLSQRELEILRLMAEGFTDKQIAAELSISRGTVSNHVSIILLKLQVLGRTHAVSKALHLGLIPYGQLHPRKSILTT